MSPICKQCNKRFDIKKGEPQRCPNCGSKIKSGDAFLHTENAHKDWYNVKGKLGKQRGKPKQDINSKDERK
jgi:PHP family Zn ribbon phosphoesterase